ncbi:MAG: hypothetical protein NTX11_00115 [Candidatus Saccharibacteria bacterium]|nr:hypothetical protein [Candidatus Saccharibacteria bacterium]
MPANKKPAKKGIKIANDNTTKKRVLLTVAVFSVIGVIFLIRSFAATTVYSVNIVDVIGAANPKWTIQGAVVAEVPNGKKTQKIVQLSKGSKLSYTYTLNSGYYKACYNLKPTSADATASIGLSQVGGGGMGGQLSIANGNIALNSYKEHCMPVSELGLNRSNISSVTIDNGSWEVTSFQIRLNEDYASYGSYGSYGGTTTPSKSTYYSLTDAIKNKDPQFTFTGDAAAVPSGSSSVLQLSGGPKSSVEFMSKTLPNNGYRMCFTAAPTSATDTAEYQVGRLNRGGALDIKVGDQGSVVNQYREICYPEQAGSFQAEAGVTAADPLYRTFKATKGTWYLTNFRIERQN